jgi:hypothetical protein
MCADNFGWVAAVARELVPLVIFGGIPFIVKYLVRWFRRQPEVRQVQLRELASDVVLAAEQYYAHGDNERKLDWAAEQLYGTFKGYGVELHPMEVRRAIEAAVYRELNGERGRTPVQT